MPKAEAPERRASLDQVAAALASQLAGVLDGWRLRGLPLADLPYAVLHVVEPLISLAADLATIWYQDSAPELAYRPVPAPLPPEEKTLASINWALAPMRRAVEPPRHALAPPHTPEPPDLPPPDIPDAREDLTGRYAVSHAWEQGEGWGETLSRLTGSMTRVVLGGARDTTVLNAQSEPGAAWARVASPDACAFCRMLATRDGSYGSLYTSAESALRVVGRGKAGDPRGTRKRGEQYHDHCRCVAFEIRPGHSFTLPEHAHGWHDEYEAARQAVHDAGGRASVKNVVHAWDARLRAQAKQDRA